MIPHRQSYLQFSNSHRQATRTFSQNSFNQCHAAELKVTKMSNTYRRKIDFNKIATSISASNSINSLHSISKEKLSIHSKQENMFQQKRFSTGQRKSSTQSARSRSQCYERDSLIGFKKPIMRNFFIGLFILSVIYFILADLTWDTTPTDNITEGTLHISRTDSLYLILLEQMKQTEGLWISLKKFHEKYFIDEESWNLLILKIAQSPQCEVKKISRNTQNEDEMISCFNSNL